MRPRGRRGLVDVGSCLSTGMPSSPWPLLEAETESVQGSCSWRASAQGTSCLSRSDQTCTPQGVTAA